MNRQHHKATEPEEYAVNRQVSFYRKVNLPLYVFIEGRRVDSVRVSTHSFRRTRHPLCCLFTCL